MTLDAGLLRDFDRFRGAEPGTSICPAPLVNLHFSQLGVVTACCFNRNHVLGTYPQQSVRQIWQGEAARELRQALAEGDLSKGCEKCLQQIAAQDFGGSHAVFYTRYARMLEERRAELGRLPDDPAPLPMKLEFNIHNACNLQCIMCHGLASSSIRTHREGLGAMPNPYDDAFVDQLEPYLPYVVEADFMGGEPFLVSVYQRIWERIGRVNPDAKVLILTNATLLDERVRGILENMNCWIHVSIDSFRKATYESIRRGADFDQVMDNVDYFRRLMAQRGHTLTWRLCPMRMNWHELPDTVSYCSEQDIALFYNQVDSPVGLSLTTLPVDELTRVVHTLEAQEPSLPKTHVGLENLQSYRDLVARLRGFLRRDNRRQGLRSRLDTSRAVIEHYSKDRERQVRAEIRPTDGDDGLTRAVKHYWITRINVEQAETTDGPSDEADRLAEAADLLLDQRGATGDSAFLRTYWKELIRTYSGVWGVTEVHDGAVFDRVDEFVARLEVEGALDLKDVWKVAMEPLPREVYEGLGLATSVDSMGRWWRTLKSRS